MGPDFNDDGRVDGYDMEYLDGPRPSSGNAGCGDIFKLGCLIPLGFMIMCSIIMTCFVYACAAITGA